VAGEQVFMTGRGKSQAFLFRRRENKPAQVADIFRGMDDADGARLLSNLLSGAIGPNDVMLFGNDTLIETVPVADISEAAQNVEQAGFSAHLRQELLAARPSQSAIGIIVRLVQHERVIEPVQNRSLKAMASREEEVARVLAPSGMPSFGSIVSRFIKAMPHAAVLPNRHAQTAMRPARAKPTATNAVPTKKNLVGRFNALSRRNKVTLIVLLSLCAVFLVSLQIRSIQNKAHTRTAAYTTSVNNIKRLTDEAEGSLIYDENRSRTLLITARTALASLPQKTKAEKSTVASLTANITAQERRILHIVDVNAQRVGSLGAPGGVITARTQTVFVSAGTQIVKLEPTGSTTPVVNLTAKARWLADDGTLLLAWLENNTLVSIDPTKETVTTLNYAGPPSPRDGALWNGKLYVVEADGTQIDKLPATISGYGRGAAWLAAPLTGSGATAIVIDGTVYAAIKGDAIRGFEKGAPGSFAAASSDVVNDAHRLAVTDHYLFALGGKDGTIAVWDKNGKLRAQYVIHGIDGNLTAFTVNETLRTLVFVTDTGAVGQIALTGL
jgi:hypothetical protein